MAEFERHYKRPGGDANSYVHGCPSGEESARGKRALLPGLPECARCGHRDRKCSKRRKRGCYPLHDPASGQRHAWQIMPDTPSQIPTNDLRREADTCLTHFRFGYRIHEAQATSTTPGSIARTILPKCWLVSI
jgi:hypothetical protein